MTENIKPQSSHVFHFFLNRKYVSIAAGKGVYIYDDQGNKYLDASGGPILCSLGHGLEEMADVINEQARKLVYVHRVDFTNPPLEEASRKLCEASDFAIGVCQASCRLFSYILFRVPQNSLMPSDGYLRAHSRS